METPVDSEDPSSKIQGLFEQVEFLEGEKQAIREEFGHQRAKMKELYLQKEEELKRGAEEQNRLIADVSRLTSELDEAKSQLVIAGFQMESDLQIEKRKCQEEIASLQQLVQETVEESSSSRTRFENEMLRLRRANERLEHEVNELRSHQQKGDSEGLAPSVMLSAVTKTLARKVASQLGADASSTSQDNLEDSMRKVNKYAQEDAEVLRSLVIPLEEEIQALKEKLRSTDQQLRKYEGNNEDGDSFNNESSVKSGKDSKTTPSRSSLDDPHLASLETVPAQVRTSTNSPKVNVMNTSVTSISSLNELQSVGASKSSPEACASIAEDGGSPISQGSGRPASCDMCSNYEAQLVRAQQRARELEKHVTSLERTTERYREDLTKESDFRKEMEDKWNEKKEEHKLQVTELKKQTEAAEAALHELRQTFTQTYNEVTVKLTSLTQEREQVHVQLSRLQKENDSLVGKHSAHSRQLQNEMINLPDKVEDLQELLLNFREELIASKVAKEAIEEQGETQRCEILLLRDQMNAEQEVRESIEDNLTAELNSLKKQLNIYERERHQTKLLQEKIEALGKENQTLTLDLKNQLKLKKQLEESVGDLRSRVGSLQNELDNSEAVQKDFVRLSQSLQVQLERIREAHTEVRWQHDDDAEECNNCRAVFSVTRRKQHCRHCGRIFCTSCLSHTVMSGPNQRPSKVCDVCHTLLVPASAPYFSTEAPHTPD